MEPGTASTRLRHGGGPPDGGAQPGEGEVTPGDDHHHRGLAPEDGLRPFSLVCKAVSANGRPTVKLSDNPAKAMGPAALIERYKRVFGVGAQTAELVLV